jgi:hypothetical protein
LNGRGRVGWRFAPSWISPARESQGETVEEARHNLVEALELFFECADPSEIEGRLRDEVFVTRLEVKI